MLEYQLREAWSKTKGCYQEPKGRQAPLTSEQLEKISTLREELYRQRPLEGELLPILVQAVSIVDRHPEVGEVAVTVKILY